MTANYSNDAEPPPFSSFVYQNCSITSNLKFGESLCFVFPRNFRFYDPKSLEISLECRLKDGQDQPLVNTVDAFIKATSLSGIFERVSVFLNAECVYAESNSHIGSRVWELFSSGEEVRRGGVFGTPWECRSSSLEVSTVGAFAPAILQARSPGTLVIQGKLPSFFSCCSQLIPSQTEVQLRLDRCNDRVTLGCFDPAVHPMLEFISASASIKAVELTSVALQRAETQLAKSGIISFYDAGTVTRAIPAGCRSILLSNVFQSSQLPDRACLALVREKSYIGDYGSLPAYFESANVSIVRFVINNMPVGRITEIGTEYHYTDRGELSTENVSSVKPVYRMLLDSIGVLTNTTWSLPLSFRTFLMGNILYPISLPFAGGTKVSHDPLDVSIQFRAATPEPLLAVIIWRRAAHVRVNSSRQYSPLTSR